MVGKSNTLRLDSLVVYFYLCNIYMYILKKKKTRFTCIFLNKSFHDDDAMLKKKGILLFS